MRHDPWENQVIWGTDPGSMVPFGFVFHLNSKTKLLPWKLHVVRIVHEAVVVGCSTADEVPKIQLGRGPLRNIQRRLGDPPCGTSTCFHVDNLLFTF
jgi:hypothetical protein